MYKEGNNKHGKNSNKEYRKITNVKVGLWVGNIVQLLST